MEIEERFKSLSNAKLEEKIAGRKTLIKKIVEFAEEIIRERGRVISRETSSDHIKIHSGLEGFHLFDFFSETGQTCFGGNSFRIYYDKKLVFSVYFQASIEEGVRVHTFEYNIDWLTALQDVMNRKSEVVAQIDEEEKKCEMKKQREREAEAKRLKLLKQAELLKL